MVTLEPMWMRMETCLCERVGIERKLPSIHEDYFLLARFSHGNTGSLGSYFLALGYRCLFFLLSNLTISVIPLINFFDT